MFTGLIEAKGQIKSLSSTSEGARLEIESSQLDFSDVTIGDSIAVNGVCLTVVELSGNSFGVDVSIETLERSCFAKYYSGQGVNLEKALLPTTRLGGHLVSGHVDGVGKVEKINQQGNAWEFIISAPENCQRYIAEKGSICIDGISLTINEIVQQGFRLTIVPHTLEKTQMGNYEVGTLVNIEVDLLARYTEQLLKHPQQGKSLKEITLESLVKAGFLSP